MTMPKSTLDVSRMFIIGGACIALLIGSGFATGQEIMQYFVAYGHAGLISILLMFALFTYVAFSFVMAGYEQSSARPRKYSRITAVKTRRLLRLFLGAFPVYVVLGDDCRSGAAQSETWLA
ncbi:hypothetical protein [Pseudomonas asiatica]|uniref:hypothetical protein n=1 Tax=Pseudomonas asiatica TaxID=2219225 RepID=UPI002015EF75|nr:hypothetical protein [Pseudomonas asiatica]